VTDRAGVALEAWRTADAHARAAEGRLREAWNDYAAKHSAPPPKELVDDVSRLRAAANEKLTGAIAAVAGELRRSEQARPARK
jgi:hypothetical protein